MNCFIVYEESFETGGYRSISMIKVFTGEGAEIRAEKFASEHNQKNSWGEYIVNECPLDSV